MTLPVSPPITMLEIQTEFGGPGNLLSYYAGGSYVPSGTANGTGTLIPTSGTIDLFDMLGSTFNFTPLVHTYTGNVGTGSSSLDVTESKPAGATNVFIELWSAGAGGAANAGLTGYFGGGSGAYANIGPFALGTISSFTVHLGYSGSGGSGGVNNGSGDNADSSTTNAKIISNDGSTIVMQLNGGQGGSTIAGAGGTVVTNTGPTPKNSTTGNPGIEHISFTGGQGGSAPSGGAGGTSGSSGSFTGGDGGTPGAGGGFGTLGGGKGGPGRAIFHYT